MRAYDHAVQELREALRQAEGTAELQVDLLTACSVNAIRCAARVRKLSLMMANTAEELRRLSASLSN